MLGISLLYLTGHKSLYKAEDQALKIIDVLQDARQLALNQRQTIRVEFNNSQNAVILIDENNSGNVSDDREIKRLAFDNSGEVKIGLRPSNIGAEPSEPTPVPQLSYAPSSHPLTQGNQAAVLRFTSTGLVLNAGVNGIGQGSTMTGATVYIWKPRKTDPNASELTRAITVLGASGAIRMWNYAHNAATPVWTRR